MMSYLACPDLGDERVAEIHKKTAEIIDNEGWVRSGDKGMITVHRLTKFTGRYKELIICEGGENLVPVPIENSVKGTCDGVAKVIVVGDKRRYNAAVVTLKAVGVNGDVPGTDQLDAGAKRVNPDITTIPAAMDDVSTIEDLQETDGSVEPLKIHTVRVSTQHAEPLKASRCKEGVGFAGPGASAPSMEADHTENPLANSQPQRKPQGEPLS